MTPEAMERQLPVGRLISRQLDKLPEHLSPLRLNSRGDVYFDIPARSRAFYGRLFRLVTSVHPRDSQEARSERRIMMFVYARLFGKRDEEIREILYERGGFF